METENKNCPLYKVENYCNNVRGESQSACWCMKEGFPDEIFTQLPEKQIKKSCICKSCLEKFRTNYEYNLI